jgi:hypothetical protein
MVPGGTVWYFFHWTAQIDRIQLFALKRFLWGIGLGGDRDGFLAAELWVNDCRNVRAGLFRNGQGDVFLPARGHGVLFLRRNSFFAL